MKKLLLLFALFCAQKAVCQSLVFAKDLGFAATDLGTAMDADGNIFLAGTAITGVDLDPTPVGEHFLEGIAGKKTAFIVKLNPAGQFVWAASVGIDAADAASEIPGSDRLKIGKNGLVHAIFQLAGNVNDEIRFWPGGQKLTTVGGSVVLTVDSNGQFVSILDALVSSNGGGSSRKFSDLDVLPDGQVVVVGSFMGFIYPSSPTWMLESAGLTDGFLIKYDPTNAFSTIQTRRFGGAKAEHLTGIGIDAAGNIYLGGDYAGTFDVDPSPSAETFLNLFSAQGPMDGMLIKLDSALNFIKAVELTATVAGDFKVEFGANGRLAASTISGSTPALFHFSNALLDKKPLSKPPSEQITSGLQNEYLKLARDGSGGFYAMSGFVDTAGGGPKMWFGVTKTQAGDLAWTFRVRGASLFGNGFEATSLAVSADGKTMSIAGFFDGSVDFDPTSSEAILTAPTGEKRAFLLKFSDPCPDLRLQFLENEAVSCTEKGRVKAGATGGVAPYFFEWQTQPPVFDSVFETSTGGFFKLKMTDATGCERRTEVFVGQPPSLDPTVFDLEARPFSATEFRPGFMSKIFFNASNLGCKKVDATVKIALDPKLVKMGISPAPDAIDGDTISWNLADWQFGEPFLANLQVFLPPSAQLGDTICLLGWVETTEAEAVLTNNFSTEKAIIIGSFDPNDIAADPPGVCAENAILPNGKTIYTVRFQNTGTASAINVRVLDTLPKSLDLQTLRIVAASHSMAVERPDSSVLAFVFDEINLPDSFSDVTDSHGFVQFELLQKPNLADGERIENRAAIYFDFNAPVLTNSVFQTVRAVLPICPTVSTDDFWVEKMDFSISPNPLGPSDFLKIELEDDAFFGPFRVEIWTIGGQLFSVFENQKTAARQVFEIEKGLPTGPFFVRVLNEKNLSRTGFGGLGQKLVLRF